MIDLRGHSALITGSTGGVGRAIAEAFARAGAHVVLHGREQDDQAQAALDACREHGVRASVVFADLTGPIDKTVPHVFETAIKAEPDIDILVNNAGGAIYYGPFVDMTFEKFERLYRLNVTTGYFLTQRFTRHWLSRKTAARVLFIGSINGRLAEVESSIYDSAKGAVEMMVKSLAAELAAHNIRVNGLAPGLVVTAVTSWVKTNKPMADWLKHHTPSGKIPDPDVCGPGAVYLVSDAAEHVIGQMLLVDGGMSCWQQPPPPGGQTW